MQFAKGQSEATCSYKGFDVYAQRKNQDRHESLCNVSVLLAPSIWVFHDRGINTNMTTFSKEHYE